MDLAAYVVQRPPDGARVTGDCQLIKNGDGIYGVELRDGARSEVAVVSKHSATARDVFEALKDGGKHRLTMDVRPVRESDGFILDVPPGQKRTPSDSNVSIILKVVKGERAPTGAGATDADGPGLVPREEFRERLLGKTKGQVIQEIGKPDKTLQDEAFHTDNWFYRRRTFDPVSGKADGESHVQFKDGVVVYVNSD
jgi:hypothetical protein